MPGTSALVVDDQVMFQDLIRVVLRRRGVEATVCATGEEAWQAYDKAPFPLVLLDWFLPGMNGVDLCRKIRAHPEGSRSLIVMITAHDDPGALDQVLDAGADDYLTKPIDVKLLEVRLAIAARRLNESQELQAAETELALVHRQNDQLLESISATLVLIALDSQGRVVNWNTASEETFDIAASSVVKRPLREVGIPWEWDKIAAGIAACRKQRRIVRLEDVRFTRRDGSRGFLKMTASRFMGGAGRRTGCLLLAEDITELKVLQSTLQEAQRLESIGHLAAGIAHEINTPSQYVSDNLRFLQDAAESLERYLCRLDDLLRQRPLPPDLADLQMRLAEEVQLDFLRAEVPAAVVGALEGIERVADIVRAMKKFSHPGTPARTRVDLAEAIRSTVLVSKGEWKHLAEIRTRFDPDVPPLPCYPVELNQAFLNIVVNAVQAIAELRERRPEHRGCVEITTRRRGDSVEILVRDNGPGIPEEIASRVFEPFFTTKEVGKGTGQGLAFARATVVEQHGGRISVESRPGEGATFHIVLPLASPEERSSGLVPTSDRSTA